MSGEQARHTLYEGDVPKTRPCNVYCEGRRHAIAYWSPWPEAAALAALVQDENPQVRVVGVEPVEYEGRTPARGHTFLVLFEEQER